MSYSPNLNLILTAESENTKTFQQWRTEMSGDDETSNIMIIDAAIAGKVDKEAGKGLSEANFTSSEKTKLAGIEAGAQVNTVTSVAGKTGAVTLDKTDVGLGNVDNTADVDKPVSSAQATAINAKADPAFAFTGTLVNTGWTGSAAPYTKAVTVTGILAAGKPPIVDVTLSETWVTAMIEDEEWAKIKRIAYTNNTLTFYATEVPTVSLNFKGVQPK